MLSPLASTAEALGFGFTVSNTSLVRASTRVRGFLRQQVSAGTSTVVGMGPSITLPESPIVAVTSVKAGGLDVYYKRSGQRIDTYSYDELTVVYSHGLATLPDELIELVSAIAARMESAPAQVAQGIQQESMGPHAISYGMDAWKAQSGLTAGEKETLRRYWPQLPRTISMGAPAPVWRSPLSPTSRFGEYV